MGQSPKRRKHKDNPYTISYCEKLNKYYISFKDVKGVEQNIEISYKLYSVFNRFELRDLSELNEFDNHIEHSEVYEITLNAKIMDKPLSVEEIVENKISNENLYKAINKLPIIQRNRIKMYYFQEMTLEKIALVEKTSHQAISKSIKNAVRIIQKNLKN